MKIFTRRNTLLLFSILIFSCIFSIWISTKVGLSGGQDYLNPKKIKWHQFPLKNDWQKQNDLQGGEGMQMLFDIDWSLDDTNVLYIAVDTTRIWKSIDRGNSWFPIGQDMLVKGGVSIVSDPQNVDVIFVAGLRHSVDGLTSNYDGIYRSLDGGLSWTGPIGNPIYFKRRHAGKLFLIDPDSFDGIRSQTIYSGTPNGIMKSVDGGDTWTTIALDGQDVYDMEWSEINKDFFYIATDNGLYKIDTETNTVTEVGADLPSHPWDIAVSSQDEKIVYVVSESGVYKSMDGGVTFIEKSNGIQPNIDYQRIISSRINPNNLILCPQGTGGLLPYWSCDGGETWNRPETICSEEMLTSGYYFAKPVIFDPENADIAITQTGGPIIKTFDGGRNWHFSGNGYTGARVRNINFISKKEMLFGLTDYGLFITEKGGKSFSDLSPPRTYDGQSCGASDIHSDTIVASIGNWSEQDILLSNDRGNTWQNVNSVGKNFDFIKFNKDNSNIVYADDWISTDKGKTWSKVNEGYEIKAMHPHNGNIVFGIKEVAAQSWEVAYSEDAGVVWKKLGEPIITSRITEISVDPRVQEMHILVAAGGWGIYEYAEKKWTLRSSDDGLGPQWNSEEIASVKFDPNYAGIVWACRRGYDKHGQGIYVSQDSGKTWENVISNLGPYNDFWNIDIDPYNNIVYITGPGVWTFSMKGRKTIK